MVEEGCEEEFVEVEGEGCEAGFAGEGFDEFGEEGRGGEGEGVVHCRCLMGVVCWESGVWMAGVVVCRASRSLMLPMHCFAAWRASVTGDVEGMGSFGSFVDTVDREKPGV